MRFSNKWEWHVFSRFEGKPKENQQFGGSLKFDTYSQVARWPLSGARDTIDSSKHMGLQQQWGAVSVDVPPSMEAQTGLRKFEPRTSNVHGLIRKGGVHWFPLGFDT